MTIAFKIWYSDHTVTGYNYTDWKAAPDNDVQAVVLYQDETDPEGKPYRIYSSGCDKYSLTSYMNYYCDYSDIVRGHTKYGAWMDWDGLMAIEQESFNDYGDWINV